MKRTELIQIIEQKGAVFFRHGSGHDIYMNKKTGKKFPVPRHGEIGNKMLKVILKEINK